MRCVNETCHELKLTAKTIRLIRAHTQQYIHRIRVANYDICP